MRFVMRTGVLVDTTFVHPVWPGLVRGAKDVLEFGACCDECVTASFGQGTFEFVGQSAAYEGYFGVGAKLDVVRWSITGVVARVAGVVAGVIAGVIAGVVVERQD